MAIAVTCECGREFAFEEQFGGQQIKCPDCSRQVTVPAAPPRPAQADPAFERDKFLIRQKIRIDEKYAVTDEQGNPILFIVRPTYLLRSLGAILGGIAAAFAWGWALVSLGIAIGEKTTLGGIVLTVGIFGAFVVLVVVAMLLQKKRHTSIYHDDRMGKALVTIEQDRKFAPVNMTYTVRDDKGKVLAKFRKNFFTNFIRKRWWVTDAAGRTIMTAVEDSPLKAFLRRFFGPAFGLLRTNYVITRGDSDDPIGQFNRKFTILDRYVLDLSDDPQRKMDRRLALAIGIMLDTGERR